MTLKKYHERDKMIDEELKWIVLVIYARSCGARNVDEASLWAREALLGSFNMEVRETLQKVDYIAQREK